MPTLSLNASKKTKHTPAGEIPVDWGWAELARFATIKHGFAFEGPSMSAKATAGPIVVAIGNFKYTGGFRFDTTKRQRFVGQEPPRDYVLKPGALLVAMTCQTPGGEILGIPGQIPDDGETYLHNQRLGLVEVTEDRALSKHYLYHLFCWEPFNKFLFERATGTKVKHTSPSTILSYPAALPPLPEQRRIAAILSTWDRAIETLESLIAAKDRRKQALMQQLLRRTSEFSRAGHSRHRLGEIVERVTRKNKEGNDNVITISGQHGLVSQSTYFNRNVASDDLSNYYLLKRGEFAYNRSSAKGFPFGAIKRLNAYDSGVVSTLYLCFRIIDEKRTCSDFLSHYFDSGMLNQGLRAIAQEGARSHGLLNVTASDFLDLDAYLPDFAAQKEIAAILDTADRELHLHRQHLEALRTQKRGLMQKLLTGQVRVAT